MADEENESRSGDEKPEVKENAPESKEKVDSDNESKVTADSDVSKKKEDIPKKAEKNQNNDKGPKKEKVTKKEEETEDDDDDDEDEEELPPGLLERPLEVEGKREKKKVERLSSSMLSSPQDKKKIEIEKGSGKQLGDIPYVEHQLNSTKAIDLKHLHRVLFLRFGTNNEVKKNIRQFSGFTHDKDSKEYEKRLACLNKMVSAELKAICLVLGLERGGTKGNLVDRIMDFLRKPSDKGLRLKGKKIKPSSAGGKTKGTKRKISKETKKKGKTDKSSDDSQGDDSEEDKEEEEEQEEEEEEEEDSEFEQPPKKKRKKAENKKKTTKKAVKENGKKEKPTPRKEIKKPTPKKKPVAEESDSLSEDSEDEPIAKLKTSPPSNDEIKDLVKKILDGADLEKVTMKIVVKQVYAKYPSFDLSDRKDFIKDTVREVIS